MLARRHSAATLFAARAVAKSLAPRSNLEASARLSPTGHDHRNPGVDGNVLPIASGKSELAALQIRAND